MQGHQQISEEVLQAITTEIVDSSHPEKIVLFGSQARGEASATSDVDLLVIFSGRFGAERSRRHLSAQLYRALAKFRVPTDLLIYSSSEVEEWKGARNHCIAQGLSHGKVLYERH